MNRLLLAILLLVSSFPAWSVGMGVEDARHLLNRIGFGATPEAIAEYARLPRQTAVERILAPVSTEVRVTPPADAIEYIPRSRLRSQRMQGGDAKDAVHKEMLRRGFLLRGWWVEEMLAARTPPQQLRERMTLFWHNHFVSALQKVKMPSLMYEQNRLFRQEGMGNFDALLRMAVKSPSMLVYLDAATSRKGEPNENLARELLELFTLGEGHYSEQDVKEAARALTGWSVDLETGRFVFRRPIHDEGEKVFLGRQGRFDGDDILDILLSRREMAEFIVTKLWREFVSPEPDLGEVQRIAREWRSSGYAMRNVLSSLFKSAAFWAPQNRGLLIKSPVDLIVGTLHTFGNHRVDGLPLAFAMAQLGQDLFNPPNVKGWPGGEAWINSNTLLLRKQMIERILRSEGKDRPRNQDKENAMREQGGMGDEFQLKRRFMSAIAEISIDQSTWMRRMQQQGLQNTQVLLALPEAYPAGSIADVRSLLLDVGYQLR